MPGFFYENGHYHTVVAKFRTTQLELVVHTNVNEGSGFTNWSWISHN